VAKRWAPRDGESAKRKGRIRRYADEVSERTEKTYDAWSSTYDVDPNPQLVLEEPEVLALLDVQRGEMVLDAACGTGRYAGHAHDAGASVTGVDASAGMLDVARRRFPGIEFVRADLEHALPLPSSSFQKIVCAQALKHISLLTPVFREFERLLLPKGSLVFSVTHPDMNWRDYELVASPAITLSTSSEIHHHTLVDYTGAIADAGLAAARLVEIPVSQRIEHLLTQASFRAVIGRPQILAMRVTKP
jgi:ubiquinone/menaquinone biosynthesis C-methylase UbiE